MFLVKGFDTQYEKFYKIIFSSVNMEEEKLLYIFLRHSDPLLLLSIDFKNFDTVNYIVGETFRLLRGKHKLLPWFQSVHFRTSLPSILFSKINKTDITHFLERGTKHKFLKPGRGHSGYYVHVVDSLEEIEHIIQKKQIENEHKEQDESLWILQDALEDVATFHGYKFHLHFWIVVVIRDTNVSVYMSKFSAYELAKEQYDIKKIKDPMIHNSHKYRNTKNAFFPMDLPDYWTSADAKKLMTKITSSFKTFFKQQHDFTPRYNMKNGFQMFSAEILVDNLHNPYIQEFNERININQQLDILIPEYLHLGLGGAPLKLFTTLYGTPEGRITPFKKSLTEFYEKTYSSNSKISDAFETIFHVDVNSVAVNGYLLYQNTTRKKTIRSTKSTTKKNKRIR